MSNEGWKSVDLPESFIERVERLRRSKYERRPGNISLGLFIEDLFRSRLEDEEILVTCPPLLEVYLIESDRVSIRDNRTDKIVELSYKEGDLYCPVDGAKNCVHVGFAWSVPKVIKILNKLEK